MTQRRAWSQTGALMERTKVDFFVVVALYSSQFWVVIFSSLKVFWGVLPNVFVLFLS
jgi:hypothetical protein